MLANYSCLKGIVSQDLEDHIKCTQTHHTFLVQTSKSEYQANIDIQSLSVPNIKVYYIEQFNNELLTNLDKLGDEGLFSLDKLTHASRLDYLRSGIFQIDYLKNMQPKPWQEISNLLDVHITCGTKICILGNSYDATKLGQVIPYGIQLRKANGQLPPRGIHFIHMNQGDFESHSKNNGIYQDGAIFIETPNNTFKAFFFMFDNQSLNTDDEGNPIV